jgi:hypothetical protein
MQGQDVEVDFVRGQCGTQPDPPPSTVVVLMPCWLASAEHSWCLLSTHQ